MATIELKVPSVGESVTEVQVGEWLKSKGDRVRKDETVVMIDSDKASVEVSAPADGVVSHILKKEGEDAEPGEVIGYLEEGDGTEVTGGGTRDEAAKKQAKAGEAQGARQDREEEAPPGEGTDQTARVMPGAQRLLDQHGVEAGDVEATGPGGRLLKEDVLRHVEQHGKKGGEGPAPAEEVREQEKERKAPRPRRGAPLPEGREEEVVPMTSLRRRIAHRLVEAQHRAALLTTFNEIDMGAVKELRERHRASFEAKYGVRLGFMSFFVKAAIEALKEIPGINAEVRDDSVVYRNYYDIGIAVGGGKGLVVPVLRGAERMSFAEIEGRIGELAQKARDMKLEPEDLQGGTFTISNGGVYGSLLSTPIVNPPQSGVLGLHAIQDRPVAHSGNVVVRPMMYVALTYDHRVVDGREAVTFLRKIKELVEDPARILLEV